MPHHLKMTAQLRKIALAERFELGPCTLQVCARDALAMPVRRRHPGLDLTHGCILLQRGLKQMPVRLIIGSAPWSPTRRHCAWPIRVKPMPF